MRYEVVMMTRAFQDATGFKIGDQVRISLAEADTAEANEIVVTSFAGDDPESGITHPKPARPLIRRYSEPDAKPPVKAAK